MASQTQIYSIFGQIEAVAAEIMIDKMLATKISAEQIPTTVAINDAGEPAQFAIVIARRDMAEFEKTIRELRA